MAKVKITEITEKVKNIFLKEGASPEVAETVTGVLLDTEMKGVVTHGFLRVPLYVKCLRSGGVLPTGDIEIVSDAPTMAVVSGKGGLGIAIAKNATELAIKKAEETGVGIVFVRGSHHLGAVGYYANMCAERGFIGMAMSNGNRMVAATGGRAPAIGNNPFAYAVPAGKYGTILYDVAMSVGSDIKVYAMRKEGRLAPDAWFVDNMGRPSNDPEDYFHGGVLLPFGGHKGYGLAIMVEMLAGAVSGAAMPSTVKAWNVEPKEEGGNTGHFIMAIDPARITDRDAYIARVEAIIEELAASPLAEGSTKIYYPGEMEKARREACLATGEVEVADDTLLAIDNLLK